MDDDFFEKPQGNGSSSEDSPYIKIGYRVGDYCEKVELEFSHNDQGDTQMTAKQTLNLSTLFGSLAEMWRSK